MSPLPRCKHIYSTHYCGIPVTAVPIPIITVVISQKFAPTTAVISPPLQLSTHHDHDITAESISLTELKQRQKQSFANINCDYCHITKCSKNNTKMLTASTPLCQKNFLMSHNAVQRAKQKHTCVTGWNITPSTLWLTSFENLPSSNCATNQRTNLHLIFAAHLAAQCTSEFQLHFCTQEDWGLSLFYTSVMQTVLEYACPVWHSNLTTGQSDMLESLQKRALRIIYSDMDYHSSLFLAELDTVYSRREHLTQHFYKWNIDCSSSCLNYLLPEQHDFVNELCRANKYEPFRTKTERFRNSCIPYCVSNFRC